MRAIASGSDTSKADAGADPEKVRYGADRSRSRRSKPPQSGLAPPATRSPLQYAYRLLSYRGRSEKELREKLTAKGFSDCATDKVIDGLKEEGFLNDAKLASSLKRYAEETKHLGVLGTKLFLRERGIPESIIEEVLKDCEEISSALRLVEKKMRSLSRCQSDRAVRRLYGMLSRRGFSPETIRKALKNLTSGEDIS